MKMESSDKYRTEKGTQEEEKKERRKGRGNTVIGGDRKTKITQ